MDHAFAHHEQASQPEQKEGERTRLRDRLDAVAEDESISYSIGFAHLATDDCTPIKAYQ